MTALQKSVQSSLFHEGLTGAYTHGLESIYAIEKVDLKTVRKLEFKEPPKPAAKVHQEELDFSSEMDLGPFYRGYTPSPLLKEPVQVLQLIKSVEKVLLDKGIDTLGTLLHANLHDTVFLKTLGSGHIEDIRKKLKEYIGSRPLKKTRSIDFISIIKCLAADLERKKAYALLDRFGLSEWVQLSPTEKAELKRLSPEIRSNWCDECFSLMREGKKAEFLAEELKIMTETWLKPWMVQRQGIAKKEELIELLELRAEDSRLVRSTLQFLEDLFQSQHFCFEAFLCSVEEDVYAADAYIAGKFYMTRQMALSYFVNKSAIYRLDELAQFVASELAKKWDNTSAQFFEKTLQSSAFFDLRRNGDGQWTVQTFNS